MKLTELARDLLQRRFAREGAWVLASQLSTLVARLAGLRIITGLLSPERYAEVALIMGVVYLARSVLCAPFVEATWRFYPDAERDGQVDEFRALLGRILRPRTAWVCIGLIAGGGLWSAVQGPAALAWAFLAAAGFASLAIFRDFEVTLLNTARRQKVFSVWKAADELLMQAGAIAAVLVLGPSPSSVLVGYALGVGLALTVFRRFAVRGETRNESSDDAAHAAPSDVAGWAERTGRSIRSYAIPLSWLAVLIWIVTYSDRYLLAALASARDTGIYAASYAIASQPFILVATTVALTLRPIFNKAAVEGDVRTELRTLSLWIGVEALVMGGGIVLMALFADEIVGVFLDAEYRSAAVLLPWIGAAYIWQGFGQVFEAVLYAQRRTHLMVVKQIVAAVVSVALYFALIPRYGALGAAIGTFGGLLASFVACLLLSGAIPRFLRGRSFGPKDAA